MGTLHIKPTRSRVTCWRPRAIHDHDEAVRAAPTRQRRWAFVMLGLGLALMLLASRGLAQPAPSVNNTAAHTTIDPAAHERSMPLGTPSQPTNASGMPATQRATSEWGIVRTVLSLAGVVSFALFVGAILRKAARAQGGLRASLGPGGRAPSGVLEVLGRYPVSRGVTLVLLRVDRRVLLLSQSSSRRAGTSMSTLCEINDAEDVASLLVKSRDDEGETMTRRFQDLLDHQNRPELAIPRDPAPGEVQHFDATHEIEIVEAPGTSPLDAIGRTVDLIRARMSGSRAAHSATKTEAAV